jgi:hypothetical protein
MKFEYPHPEISTGKNPYSRVMVFDYISNTISVDTTFNHYFTITSVDTTGRFLASYYDKEFHYDSKLGRYYSEDVNQRLMLFDTRTNNVVVDTSYHLFSYYKSQPFQPYSAELSPDGQYFATVDEGYFKNLSIHKINSNTFELNTIEPHNTYQPKFDPHRTSEFRWSSDSKKIFFRYWFGIRDSNNNSAIYDIDSDTFIKSFDFEWVWGYEVLNESYLFAEDRHYTGGTPAKIKVYSATSIPASVIAPIDNKSLDDLLNSNKNYKIYDINGDEVFIDERNNKIKYERLERGRYFIQTEEKTYKIIKE